MAGPWQGLRRSARMYIDPFIGRYLSVDPLTVMDTGDPNASGAMGGTTMVASAKATSAAQAVAVVLTTGRMATFVPIAPAVTAVGTTPAGLTVGLDTPAQSVNSLAYKTGAGIVTMAGTTKIGRAAATAVGLGAGAKVVTDNKR